MATSAGFLERRAQRVSKELKKRVIPQAIDPETQAVDDDLNVDDEGVLESESRPLPSVTGTSC
jgi:hypothetical protein